MNQPFEAWKNAEELGIDTSRTFVVVNSLAVSTGESFPNGEIIRFIGREGDTARPGGYFKNKDDKTLPMYWQELAYADQPEKQPAMKPVSDYLTKKTDEMVADYLAKTPYVPRVGDRVSLEGEIRSISDDNTEVWVSIPEEMKVTDETYEMPIKVEGVKLLSRKSPRVVTQEEVNAAFGEEVTIEG